MYYVIERTSLNWLLVTICLLTAGESPQYMQAWISRKEVFRYRTTYRCLADAPPGRTRDSESLYVIGLAHPPSQYYNSPTHSAPPPFCFSYCIFIALWKPTKSWTLQIKQALGGEWSRPLCSRPQVGSSKGPKPVVIWWSASHPPWVCNTNSSFEHFLIYFWTNHSCEQSVWWDANHSLWQRIINREQESQTV